jgi:DNA polymerase delta subunit 3
MSMETCLEEISSTVLDAGEPISYRTLGIRSQVSSVNSVAALERFSTENSGVKVLHVLIKHSPGSDADKSETAAARHDPRTRVLSVTTTETDGVLCSQIYALYGQDGAEPALATACWAQERQARNDVLGGVAKHAPLTAAARALYASGVKCAEATARQDFGEEQGEETISAFDAINASAQKSKAKAASSSSFFKSSGKTGLSKASGASRNRGKTESKPEAKKLDMSNVLTVDSDDDEDDEDEADAPVFVKTTTHKRVISDDDDEEDEPKAKMSTPAPKSRNVKRKLNASPAEIKKAGPSEEEGEHANKKQHVESEEEEDDEPVEVPAVATKRRVLVSKTRINEKGYMVTEKTYEDVELTAEEVEKEQKAAKKRMEEKKKQAAAEKAAKAKKEAKKHSGPAKQRDLRSFFSAK